MRFIAIGLPICLLAASASMLGCNEILGLQSLTYSPEDGGGDGGVDAWVQEDGSTADSTISDGSRQDASDGNTSDTNVPDTNVPDTSTPPPATAAKPGFDVTAGGTYGSSPSYRLIAVAGESPGGNNVGKSQSYVLKAGVIATTQSN